MLAWVYCVLSDLSLSLVGKAIHLMEVPAERMPAWGAAVVLPDRVALLEAVGRGRAADRAVPLASGVHQVQAAQPGQEQEVRPDWEARRATAGVPGRQGTRGRPVRLGAAEAWAALEPRGLVAQQERERAAWLAAPAVQVRAQLVRLAMEAQQAQPERPATAE